MCWTCALAVWLFFVWAILRFFQVACALDDEDPVDIRQERSEIDSWPR